MGKSAKNNKTPQKKGQDPELGPKSLKSINKVESITQSKVEEKTIENETQMFKILSKSIL